MPLPNLGSLQAAPEQLRTWCDSNILTAGTVTNALNPAGVTWARIVQRPPMAPGMPAPTGQDAAGHAVDVYDLRCDGAGPHDGVPAHICNYMANNIRDVQLDNTPDYMFTINLNGCTFGVGAPQPNGNKLVSHANAGGNAQVQRGMTGGAHGGLGGVALLEPALYRNLGGQGQNQATVFGIRSGLNWRFYFQSYTYLGNQTFRLNGVFPFPGI